jgi:hypothetical protein
MAVGEMAGQRCGERADGSGDAEHSGDRATKAKGRLVQHHGEGRPECAKGGRQETLGNCGITQNNVALPKAE